MKLPPAFWDSSALVPLCTRQPQTPSATALQKQYGIVAWWAAQVEIWSGLTRLKRMGGITQSQMLAGLRLTKDLVRDWITVHASSSITDDACMLLELYPLRAADALQLAAALEACEHRPQGYVFISGDQRQSDAARQSGFSVKLI